MRDTTDSVSPSPVTGRMPSESKSSPTKQGAESFEVSRVPPDLVDAVFDRLGPIIRRGLMHGAGDASSEDHLRDSIKRGDMVMWAVHEDGDVLAAIVLSVQKFAAKTTVFVELAAGRDMERWVERIEGLLRDFRDLVGADTIEATCRDGMARRLKGRWRRKATLMELR